MAISPLALRVRARQHFGTCQRFATGLKTPDLIQAAKLGALNTLKHFTETRSIAIAILTNIKKRRSHAVNFLWTLARTLVIDHEAHTSAHSDLTPEITLILGRDQRLGRLARLNTNYAQIVTSAFTNLSTHSAIRAKEANFPASFDE